MNLKLFGIFQIVEIVFFISVLINIASYITGFSIILYKKNIKGFLITLREGWSYKYLTQNVVSFSMLFTSLSVFWFMLIISTGMKKINIAEAYRINPFITIYIVLSCLVLIVFSIYLYIGRREKEQVVTD